jgi:hypothetical protein
MTGWNLPPGVTEGMLPGNRPADEAAERLHEALIECIRLGFTIEDIGEAYAAAAADCGDVEA